MVKRSGVLAVLPALLAGAPVAAQAQADDNGLSDAMSAAQSQDYASVAAKAHAVVAKFDAQNSAPGTTYYCAHTQAETLVYAVPGKTGNKKVVVTGPDWCDAIFLEAYALSELKRPADAVPLLRRLTVLAPMRAHYRNELGYALQQTGNTDGALESYRISLSLAGSGSLVGADPHMEAAALRGIGFALVEKGDWDGGEKAYRDSQKIEPDSEIAKHELEYIANSRPKG